MRAAVIDLGTNTFNLIIAEKQNGKFVELYRDKRSVKLGKEGFAKNIIAPDAYQRAITAIKEYMQIIKKSDTKSIKAVATSAFRSTQNGATLAKEIEQIIESEVEIIDGDKEAEYIYYGIKAAVPLNNEIVLMIDIGGGSNELILANNEKIFWKKSYPLGISRLIENFKPSDPLNHQDINSITKHIKATLNDFIEIIPTYNIQTLVGSSGSFDLIANIIHFKEHNKPLDPSKTYNYLNLLQFTKVLDTLIISSYEQRKDIQGMDMTRIEMIPIAALFVRTIIEYLRFNKIIHSAYAIKEGVWIKTYCS
jgi:exopolyphosphatase/guanosine-5'-triphosphate,3'-diphosphate pyrophosphatase